MRVREVMSIPVVCVPPDAPLKNVARVLVTHGISAVPVVDAGELVGILSEADLIPLELAPDPRAHLAPLPEGSQSASRIASAAMTRDVIALPEAAELGEPSPYRVTVRDGVVDLSGPSDPVDRRLAGLLARGVPGVLEVRLDEE